MTPAPAAWSPEPLQLLAAAAELDVAARGPDGALRRWTPVWVVSVGEDVFVRSWHRRATGWFGHAVASERARVRLPGLEAEVAVVDLGSQTGHLPGGGRRLGEVLDAVDAAYRVKYAALHGAPTVAAMVSAQARATTLRLDPL